MVPRPAAAVSPGAYQKPKFLGSVPGLLNLKLSGRRVHISLLAGALLDMRIHWQEGREPKGVWIGASVLSWRPQPQLHGIVTRRTWGKYYQGISHEYLYFG